MHTCTILHRQHSPLWPHRWQSDSWLLRVGCRHPLHGWLTDLKWWSSLPLVGVGARANTCTVVGGFAGARALIFRRDGAFIWEAVIPPAGGEQ